jgi:hypothetical protein
MIEYQYYLISIIPDPIRNEQVNVGVIGLCEGIVEYRFLSSSNKINAIAPEFEYSIDSGKSIVNLLLNIPQDKRDTFLSEIKNEYVNIYPPARGLIYNKEDLGSMMDQLYDRLVKPLIKHIPKNKVSNLKMEVQRTFKKKGLLGEKITEKKIIPDYIIPSYDNLITDFAFQNGHFNIIETIDYRMTLKGMSSKFKETAFVAIKLDEARKKIDIDAKGMILYIPPDIEGINLSQYQSLLKDYYNEIYDYSNPKERSSFYSLVDRELGTSIL